MQIACYYRAVANITLKAVPDDLHAQLKRRAADAGVSVRAYVLELIKRDISRPSPEEWLAGLEKLPRVEELSVSPADLIREARGPLPVDADSR
jgi:plasmid stability protein